MNTIKFYKVGDDYGFFSNFWESSIFIDSEIWPTVEHYFQASKFQDEELKRKIRKSASPLMAANEGRSRVNILKSDWEMIKDSVMEKALNVKFLQHPELRKKILDTADAIIVEHTENDNYWGDGGDGTGQNKLGKLLMKIRASLLQMESDSNLVIPPWMAFQNIDQHDMFWRMGFGETYLYQWSKYYLHLNAEEKNNYIAKFPADVGWDDIYD